MGFYLESAFEDDRLYGEVARLAAIDRARPFRSRGDWRLNELVRRAATTYGTAGAAISIVTADEQVFLARDGIEAWSTSRDVSFCDLAIQRPGETTILSDIDDDPRAAGRAGLGIRFYAGHPIVDHAGYALGALCIFDPEPRSDAGDMTELVLLARRAERLVCH